MLDDITDFLKHCETCEKHLSLPVPSKSVISCDDSAPNKQWAINVIGQMPNNSQKKRYIITGLTSSLDGMWLKQ